MKTASSRSQRHKRMVGSAMYALRRAVPIRIAVIHHGAINWGAGPMPMLSWSTRARSRRAAERANARVLGKCSGDPPRSCEDTIAVFVPKLRKGIREVVIIVRTNLPAVVQSHGAIT